MLPCLSPSPGVCPNSCPLSQWYHPTILSSIIPFSSCLQSFPAPGSFPMSPIAAPILSHFTSSFFLVSLVQSSFLVFLAYMWNKVPLKTHFPRSSIPLFVSHLQTFSGGSVVKESPCNAGDPGLIPGLGRAPGEGHGNPLQYSCLENPMDRWSLAGYSPWGHKELDTTEATQHTACAYKKLVKSFMMFCKNVHSITP